MLGLQLIWVHTDMRGCRGYTRGLNCIYRCRAAKKMAFTNLLSYTVVFRHPFESPRSDNFIFVQSALMIQRSSWRTRVKDISADTVSLLFTHAGICFGHGVFHRSELLRT